MAFFSTLRGALAGLVLLGFAGAAQAEEEVFLRDGYAVSGYDVVSYHSAGAPVVGDDAYTYEHAGAVYRFASADNRDLFASDPEAYAPAYGGFCAYGAANGYKVPTDPLAYRVVDGQLYLNVNSRVQQIWEGDIPGYIRGADNNWPLIRDYASEDLRDADIPGLTLGPQ